MVSHLRRQHLPYSLPLELQIAHIQFKCYENPPAVLELLNVDKRTDRHDKANGAFLQLFLPNTPKLGARGSVVG
jgi:hypothetical protein